MKILYHHRIRSKDGQFVHIEELTSALRARGHEIVMAGPAAVESEEFGADGGFVDVVRRLLPRMLSELLELAYALVAYRRLLAAWRRHRPDCLYERYNLFSPAGVWLRRKTGIPMLLEVNAPLVDERSRFGGLTLERLAHWSEGLAWREADRVLPVTNVLADHIRAAGVPEGRIAVIANGIDPARFAGAPDTTAAKQALGVAGRLVLGFTGFVRPWHGLDRVLEAIAEDGGRRDLHLLVVGDGPAVPALRMLARERGIAERLSVTGVVGRGDVAARIAAFDIALQPDVVAYASPLKLFEYMALGRAIVAPATRNMREVLGDGENALLFDPGDPAAFRTALERLCDDEALRVRLGTAARRTIVERGFTWQENARRVEAIFRELGVKEHDVPAGIGTPEVPAAE